MNKNRTLKNCCILFVFVVFAIPVLAQDNAGMYPKNIRAAVAVQGFIAYPGRLGASLDGKLMLRGNVNKDVYNEFVITGKASHAPANDGGTVLSAFDGRKYDNISALFLMAGYRINFGLPVAYSKDIDAIGGAFIELNAGGTYVHHVDNYYIDKLTEEEGQFPDFKKLRTWAPAISGVAGYTVSKKLEVILSYTGAWPVHKTGKIQQSFIGAGLQYNF